VPGDIRGYTDNSHNGRRRLTRPHGTRRDSSARKCDEHPAIGLELESSAGFEDDLAGILLGVHAGSGRERGLTLVFEETHGNPCGMGTIETGRFSFLVERR